MDSLPRIRNILVVTAVFSLALAWTSANAQQEAEPEPIVVNVPVDDFNRGTPKRSAEGFMTAIDSLDYDRATEYMDLRNLRGEAEEIDPDQLARRLSVILTRATWLEIYDLVDHPDGSQNDGLPSYRDAIGIIQDEESGREIQLYMQRVPRGDGVFIWKVSNATVSLIPELYDVWGYPESVEKVRQIVPDVRFLGIELFKFVIAMAAGIAAYIAILIIAFAVRTSFSDPSTPAHKRIVRFLVLPVGLWLFVITATETAEFLGRGGASEAWREISPIPVLVTVWMLFTAINLVRDTYINRQRRDGRQGASMLARPFANAVKLVIGIAAVLTYLDQIGVNITTLLAGLGVGGVAVALALQKPMEDVFGAITLYTQQPIRIGDFCRIGNEMGTIEEIGLRTTRVRTLANTVIAIPNSRLSTEPIDNFSVRQKILYRPELRLRQDTDADQVELVLGGIRELLGSHERVMALGQRVRFTGFAVDALLIEAFAYIDTTEWIEYLEIAEELNLAILRIAADAGTSLSLPARTMQIEQPAESA